MRPIAPVAGVLLALLAGCGPATESSQPGVSTAAGAEAVALHLITSDGYSGPVTAENAFLLTAASVSPYVILSPRVSDNVWVVTLVGPFAIAPKDPDDPTSAPSVTVVVDSGTGTTVGLAAPALSTIPGVTVPG